jgi:hypothetical protein
MELMNLDMAHNHVNRVKLDSTVLLVQLLQLNAHWDSSVPCSQRSQFNAQQAHMVKQPCFNNHLIALIVQQATTVRMELSQVNVLPDSIAITEQFPP